MQKDILILSSYFDSEIIDNLFSVSEYKKFSYDEILDKLNNSGNFSRINLKSFLKKHFSCEELFLGKDIIIKRISEKYKVQYLNNEQTIENVIKIINPKVVILRDISSISIEFLIKIKNINNLNFKVILLNGFPIRNYNDYMKFDHVIFRNPWLSQKFSHKCKSSNIIYHCFNSKILNHVNIKKFEDRNKLVAFDGSSYSHGFYQHKKRYFFLYHLLDKKIIHANIFENNSLRFNLIFYIFRLKKISNISFLIIRKILEIIMIFNKNIFKRFYKLFDKILNDIDNFDTDNYQNFYRGPLTKIFKNQISTPNFGFKYYENINDSKISINIHTESMDNYAGNIRMFEITGLKSCMLIENFENLKDLFQDEKEVVTYNSLDDLKDKISYLKNNQNFAKDIAENGYQRVISSHTDIARFPEYLNTLKKLF